MDRGEAEIMDGCKVYRFHVRVDGRRTSVSVDTMVASALTAGWGLGEDALLIAAAVQAWAQDET